MGKWKIRKCENLKMNKGEKWENVKTKKMGKLRNREN